MEDERWEPGMPVLDRQAVRTPTLPPSLQGLPPRSVPEVAPTPLQQHYILLSVPVLIAGTIAITALELGHPLGSPLVKLCVLVARAAPRRHDRRCDPADLALGLGLDADRPVKGIFRLAWVAVSLIGARAPRRRLDRRSSLA